VSVHGRAIVAVVAGAHCRPELGPQYGGSRHPIAGAISKLLQLKDPDVVGVYAQLGYVDEPRLSSVLAANYASTLQVGTQAPCTLVAIAVLWVVRMAWGCVRGVTVASIAMGCVILLCCEQLQ